MAAYQLRTFKEIIDRVMEQLKLQSGDTVSRNRIKANINAIYMDEVVPFKRWQWLRGSRTLQTEPFTSAGTANVQQNLVSVTLSQAPNESKKGYWFSAYDGSESYRIVSHAAGSASIVLETPYSETTAAATGYRIWTDSVVLPSDCKETIEISHNFMNEPMSPYGLQEFRRLSSRLKVEGRPHSYTTTGFKEPDAYEDIVGLPASVTRTSAGLSKTVSFAANMALYLSPGNQVEIMGAGEYSYNIQSVVSSVDGANVTFTGTVQLSEALTADTGIVIRRKSNEAYEAYREMLIYPAVSDKRTVMLLDYIKNVEPLDLDTDEPLLPMEDRIALFYGAMWLSCDRERNPEWATQNYQLFQAKLTRMAGKTEDSPDKPVIAISTNYLGSRRQNSRSRDNGMWNGFGGGGGGGGGSAVTGIPNSVSIFDNSGNLISSPNVSVTELNVLDNFTAAKVPNVPTGNLVATNIQAAVDELQADIDGLAPSGNYITALTGDVVAFGPGAVTAAIQPGVIDNDKVSASAAIELSKLEALAVNKALVSDAAGEIVTSSVTNTELSYVSGVTSSIQTQIDSKAADSTTAAHIAATSGVHGVTGNVVGTTDTQTLTNKTLTAPAISSPTGLVQADVGLSNVDNTSDATKNAATVTLTNKTLTAPVINSPTGIVKADVGLGSVDNTSDATKNAAVATLTNKTFGDAPTFTQIATPTTPSAGLNRIYPKSDSKFYTLDSAGTEVQIGAGGSSGINLLSANPDFESNATGYAAYKDVAGARPVDGTGGTAALTITRSAATPIIGTASGLITKAGSVNLQGEGISFDLVVPIGLRGRVNSFRMLYTVSSGTYASGDMVVDFYDVTNASVAGTQPSGTQIQSIGTGLVTQQVSQIQIPINCASLRVCLHVASASTANYVLQIDDLSFGPQVIAQGTPFADMGLLTTTGTWVSGTTTYSGQYFREGQFLVGNVTVTQTGAPTATTLGINLPSGLSIDTAKLLAPNSTNFELGTGRLYRAATGSSYLLALRYSSATQFTISTNNAVSVASAAASFISAEGGLNATSPYTIATGDQVIINYRFPITGWSSNVQMSSDTDTRVCIAKMTTSNTSIVSGTTTPLFSVSEIDTHGGLNLATGEYTVKVPGYYKAVANLNSSAAVTGIVNASATFRVSKNAVEVNLFGITQDQSTGSMSVTLSGSSPSFLANAGDVLKVTVNSGKNTWVGNNFARDTYVQFERITGPSQIAATETIAAMYQASTTTLVNNTVTTVVQTTRLTDTHLAYNTSTGVFTAPAPGVYDYSFIFEGAASQIPASAAKRGSYAVAVRNGTAIKYGPGFYGFQASTATTAEGIVTGSVSLITGDTLSFQGYHNLGANGSVSTGTETTTSIVRRGL